MTEKKSITQEAPPVSSLPAVDFDKPDFENFITQKGYDVWHEKAIKCPCRNDSSGAHQPLSSCDNCAGSGWLFINRTKTKMVLHSMNMQTKYLQWSIDKVGTVSITARDIDKLAEMDRITVLDGETIYTETVHPIIHEKKLFAFLSYDIIAVEFAFIFEGPKKKLKRLFEGSDFIIDNNKILLDKKFLPKKDEKFNVSLRYTHRPTYHILDIPRDAMVTDVEMGAGRESVQMPIHGIGRRAHYVPDFDNLEGSRVFDNSTVDYPKGCKI